MDSVNMKANFNTLQIDLSTPRNLTVYQGRISAEGTASEIHNPLMNKQIL